MRRGFTLLEAIAAVVTLGLLAAAVVPLLRQLGTATLSERMQAQAWLRTLALPDDAGTGSRPVAGHPGWSLAVEDLVAEPEAPRQPGALPAAGPAHRWRLVRIRGDDGGTLAETVVAVLAPGVRR